MQKVMKFKNKKINGNGNSNEFTKILRPHHHQQQKEKYSHPQPVHYDAKQ